MAEWLAHPTLDHEVLGSNPTRGDCMALHYTEPFIITFPSQYDLNDVERDVKHQTIIILISPGKFKFCVFTLYS